MKSSQSIAQKRHRKIVDLIKDKGELHVHELSEILGVSDMTIRRDINELEQAGLIERFHGGARLKKSEASINEDQTTISMSFSSEINKDAIAKAAADLVEDGDIVFINSGTTTLSVIKYLQSRPVHVITNNALASVFMKDAQMELILTGGVYRHESMAMVGDLAISNISRFYADKCILGAKGVSAERGITTQIQTGTFINEMMINQLKGPCIVVADGSKIGKTFEYMNIKIDKVNVLITDQTADLEELAKIEQAGVRVLITNP